MHIFIYMCVYMYIYKKIYIYVYTSTSVGKKKEGKMFSNRIAEY